MTCWVCGQEAVWKVHAQKAGRPKTEGDPGAPEVLVEFGACEAHVPFALAPKGAAS